MDGSKFVFLILSLLGFAMLYALSLKSFSIHPAGPFNSTGAEVLKHIDEQAQKCRNECSFVVVSSSNITSSEIEKLTGFNASGDIPAGEEAEVIVRRAGDSGEIIIVPGALE